MDCELVEEIKYKLMCNLLYFEIYLLKEDNGTSPLRYGSSGEGMG